MDDLSGKHVVVTGGTGALGDAVVRRLLAGGARVHVPAVETEVPAHLRGVGGVAVTTGVDLADEGAVRAFYDAVPELWASLQLAGGFAMAAATETSVAELERMFRLNAATCFVACREAARAMRRGGGGGRLVNVGARPAVTPVAGMVAYAVSKAAVASLTQCLAEELRGDGILVNAVLPSIIDTPANRAAMPDADHARWPTPAQIAETMAFLASPANALTSGALIPVYGAA